ncbi:hypothetical protein VTP01DRAFT_8978 [Rhizomucor pusillus]|uniref:uncharacterized protein n=1 Tax=Rhizomucor pusillus TaxID=4840 RepID=UPI0037424B21
MLRTRSVFLSFRAFTIRRAFSSVAPAQRFEEKDDLHRGSHYARIPERGVLEIEGPDTAKFLQGLTTNHMPLIAAGGDGFFTAFLTPQGRMLYDTFIYPVNVGVNFPHPKFVIECPKSSTSTLLKHLKRYVLRSKVKIRDASEEYSLYSVWGDALVHGPGGEEKNVPTGSLVKGTKRISDIGCMDPRVPGFGYRAVLPQDKDIKSIVSSLGDYAELPETEYTIRRILHGIPEGVHDIWPEQSLPLESNFDYMNGVDFRKGCYVGQELTIRTYHTGVVRKRIVPVQFFDEDESFPEKISVNRDTSYPSSLEPRMDIKSTDASKKRGAGKLGSGIHNIALAIMRLEDVQKAVNDKNSFVVPHAQQSGLRLRPFVPEWWPVEPRE